MIRLEGVSKRYSLPGGAFYALRDVSFDLPEAGLVFITGKSGSGKSTLLSVLGGILSPSEGRYLYGGRDVAGFSKREKEAFLREKISFVFQDFNLLQDFSVRENLSIAGARGAESQDMILKEVSLLGKASTAVGELSGGEKQRLAIARALAKGTETLLLDEPTGNLDKANGAAVFSLLRQIAEKRLVVVVSHDEESVALYGDVFLRLADGRLAERGVPGGMEHRFGPSLDADRAFLGLLSDVESSDCRAISLSEDGSSSRLPLPKAGRSLFLAQEISSRSGLEFAIRAEKNPKEPEKRPALAFLAPGVPSFGFRKRAAYAFSLLKKRAGRAFATVLSLSLGIALLFAHSSLLFFSEERALSSAFLSEGLTLSPAFRNETNPNTEENADYATGKGVRTGLEGLFGAAFPYLTASLSGASSPTLVYVVGIDRAIAYRGVEVAKPGLWHASLSSFLYDLNGKSEVSLLFAKESWRAEASLGAERLDFGYEARDLARHLSDQSYQYEKRDLFQARYTLAFVAQETLEAIVSSAVTYSLHGGNFALSGRTTKAYFDAMASYAAYAGEPLSVGSAPAGFSVAVSADFALANLLGPGESPSSLVGKEYSYKDFDASPNRVVYQGYPNLFSLTPKISIAGVYQGTGAEVLVSPGFLLEIQGSLMECPDGFEAHAETPAALAHGFASGPFRSSLKLASPVYEIESAVNSVLFYVLLAVGLALLTISGLFMGLSCLANVKEKTREIAVLRSLGIPKESVSSVFLIENALLAAISSLFGLLLGWLFVFGINQAFMNAGVFGIAYALLSAPPLAFVLGVAGSLLIALSATIGPIRKAGRIDIASTLRSL